MTTPSRFRFAKPSGRLEPPRLSVWEVYDRRTALDDHDGEFLGEVWSEFRLVKPFTRRERLEVRWFNSASSEVNLSRKGAAGSLAYARRMEASK